ncbi:glycosyltransferase family 4 protein [Roseomonas haemaphysalidis]|uniref:Glycosyltransferase family 4 protein n=1 Tax=Roseomonas haemaphysalidis TaxID=2768162 RepID=A0ABS3KRN3_9PROT|nr:glycosyltransferase family 1 protein [Roseomonas haemaphysalidis]MBO1080140.1 glycosyltransferase family 4 protein [Roseomonas haemaphysalidis]
MTYWIDVEDLYEYALVHNRPSGIQRLSFELYTALVAARPDGIGFCRHDRLRGTMRTVEWAEVAALFQSLVVPEPRGASAPVARPVGQAGQVRRLASRLPADIRLPLGEAVRAQGSALRAGLRAGRGAMQAGLRLLRDRGRPAGAALPHAAPGQDVAAVAKPGDMLLVLGSPWFRTDYAELLQHLRARCGLGVAMLVYDLIPLTRPEFCDPGLVRTFRAWFAGTMPLVDRFFAISRATARDLERYAAVAGLPLTHPVAVLPVGTGYSGPPVAAAVTPRVAALGTGFVLLVSTIEARKNHLLAFRAWRRLLDQLPPEQLPTLVLAGRVGWMVEDLMQQLENCGWLGGKVVLLDHPTDAELTALYGACRFTLFPSHYEGWGLPVTESLGFGKVCVASSTTSVPEAGGAFCLYHDPESVPEAVAILRRLIAHPEEVAGMEARLRRDFRPTPWTDTAGSLLRALEQN